MTSIKRLKSAVYPYLTLTIPAPEFTLTELRAFQLHCIKQLEELKQEAKTIPVYHVDNKPKPCKKFIAACDEEIAYRKYLFNHPEEIQF